MSSRYEIHWHSGNSKNIISNFNNLDYVRAENDYGVMVLTMALDKWNYDDFRLNDTFEIWREKNGVISLQNETSYFLRDWELYTRNGEHLVDLYAYDANWLLDTRIVAYVTDSAEAKKTDFADDMIKQIVRENMGSSAAAARQISTVTIDADKGKSVSLTKGFAWRNVLQVCKEIAETATAEGTYTCFDMIRTDVDEYRFSTFTGQRGIDHSIDSDEPRPVGESYGNLDNVSFGTLHSDELNYIYAGGQGQQDDRVVEEKSDSTRIAEGYPYNRVEGFQDARHCDTVASVQAEANSALRANLPKKIITGKLVDTEGMQFGVHYGFGDIVSVEAFGYSVDCHISSLMMKVNSNGEEDLTIRLRGEL